MTFIYSFDSVLQRTTNKWLFWWKHPHKLTTILHRYVQCLEIFKRWHKYYWQNLMTDRAKYTPIWYLHQYHDIYVRIACLIFFLQIGHFFNVLQHVMQLQRCPQGTNTIFASLCKHILHFFSSSSCLMRELSPAKNYIEYLMLYICFCWSPPKMNMFYLTKFCWKNACSKILDFSDTSKWW